MLQERRGGFISITLIELPLINQLICRSPIPAADPPHSPTHTHTHTPFHPHPNPTSSQCCYDIVVMREHSYNVMEMLQRRYLRELITHADVLDPLQCLRCVRRCGCITPQRTSPRKITDTYGPDGGRIP